MMLSRIPLMSYAIFLAIVANTAYASTPELKDFGPTPLASQLPLQVCEGDCDNDSDCASGLRCFQRDGLTPVPGCSGSGIVDYDYCVLLEPESLKDFGPTPLESQLPLQLCKGDCDDDSDCASGLRCFQRDGHTPVPGCSGSGTFNYDYCIFPELKDFGSPASQLPLKLCEGDCDDDSDCASGLKCFQRNGLSPVPRCSGSGTFDHDYCITPSTPTSDGGAGGDPHFKTFNRNFFSFHGACDLVLMQSKKFASGLGIAIHVRTSRVDSPRISYSYISSAAVKIGEHILEISDDGELLVNGDKASDEPSSFAGYSLARNIKGSKGRILAYSLYLGASKIITIRANTKTGMVYVDIDGYFGDSEGLLGAPAGAESESMGLLARDGELDLTGHWNTFGEEWQVRDTDPMLFKERRAPQYPAGCVYEAPKADPKAKYVRRRLMEDATGVSRDVATAACANLAAGQKQEFCIADVMATGDLELAEDPFYN